MALDINRLRHVVIEATALAAGIAPQELSDDSNLLELGLDSLSLAGILIDIEDGMGAEVPAGVLDGFLATEVVTVADVVRVLSSWNPGAPSGTVPRYQITNSGS